MYVYLDTHVYVQAKVPAVVGSFLPSLGHSRDQMQVVRLASEHLPAESLF